MPNKPATTKATTSTKVTTGTKKATTAKPPVTKTNTAKTESKGNTKATSTGKADTEKKTARRNLNETIGFIYGGNMKASHVYVFALNNKDVTTYVKENLVEYFGSEISGRYVKCENSEEAFASLLEQAEKNNYCTEPGSKILKCAVTNAATLCKEVTGSASANVITIKEKEAKEGKEGKEEKAKKTTGTTSTKGAKKD